MGGKFAVDLARCSETSDDGDDDDDYAAAAAPPFLSAPLLPWLLPGVAVVQLWKLSTGPRWMVGLLLVLCFDCSCL